LGSYAKPSPICKKWHSATTQPTKTNGSTLASGTIHATRIISVKSSYGSAYTFTRSQACRYSQQSSASSAQHLLSSCYYSSAASQSSKNPPTNDGEMTRNIKLTRSEQVYLFLPSIKASIAKQPHRRGASKHPFRLRCCASHHCRSRPFAHQMSYLEQPLSSQELRI